MLYLVQLKCFLIQVYASNLDSSTCWIKTQVHAYERSNRVYNYTLDPCGPVYITVGDGGNREKMAIKHADEPGNCPEPSKTPDEFMGGFCAYNFTSGPAAGNFCWDRQPEYSAYRESSFGHGILEVSTVLLQIIARHYTNEYQTEVLNQYVS